MHYYEDNELSYASIRMQILLERRCADKKGVFFTSAAGQKVWLQEQPLFQLKQIFQEGGGGLLWLNGSGRARESNSLKLPSRAEETAPMAIDGDLFKTKKKRKKKLLGLTTLLWVQNSGNPVMNPGTSLDIPIKGRISIYNETMQMVESARVHDASLNAQTQFVNNEKCEWIAKNLIH